jgi:hypothetical protein
MNDSTVVRRTMGLGMKGMMRAAMKWTTRQLERVGHNGNRGRPIMADKKREGSRRFPLEQQNLRLNSVLLKL